MLYTLFSILLVITGVLLVLVVLIQNSKGGGLAANFASSNQTFGVRQTADILEKATWYLTVAIFVFCFAATASIPRSTVQSQRKESAVQKEYEARPEVQSSFPSVTDQNQGGSNDSL